MLDALKEFEKNYPTLLDDEEGWHGVFVDYHRPYVERLWRQFGENRLYLHKIYPCKKEGSLFHPHPWPQAVKVLSGEYEMGVGYGADLITPPPIAITLLITAGTSYEMADSRGWHYVRPLGEPSYSLMVTGKPWKHEISKTELKSTSKQKLSLPELTVKQRTKLLSDFKKLAKV